MIRAREMVDDSRTGTNKVKLVLKKQVQPDDSRAKVRLTLIFSNICEENHYYREQLVQGIAEAKTLGRFRAGSLR